DALRAVPHRAARVRVRARARARRDPAALLRLGRVGVALGRRRRARPARLRDRGGGGVETLKAWVRAAAIALIASAARAQPTADLAKIQAAIAASRERVATYEREQRGLLEAIDAIDQSAALLRVEAVRARRAADEARVSLQETERTMHDAAARLAELGRAM